MAKRQKLVPGADQSTEMVDEMEGVESSEVEAEEIMEKKMEVEAPSAPKSGHVRVKSLVNMTTGFHDFAAGEEYEVKKEVFEKHSARKKQIFQKV